MVGMQQKVKRRETTHIPINVPKPDATKISHVFPCEDDSHILPKIGSIGCGKSPLVSIEHPKEKGCSSIGLLTPSAVTPALNVAIVTGRAIVEATISVNICEVNSSLQVSLARLVLARPSILKDKITTVDSDGELTARGNTNKVVKSVAWIDGV